MCRTSWKFSEKSENFPKKVLTNPKEYAIIKTQRKEKKGEKLCGFIWEITAGCGLIKREGKPSFFYFAPGADERQRRKFHYTTPPAILSRLFRKLFIYLFFPKHLTFSPFYLIIKSRGEPLGRSPKPTIAPWGVGVGPTKKIKKALDKPQNLCYNKGVNEGSKAEAEWQAPCEACKTLTTKSSTARCSCLRYTNVNQTSQAEKMSRIRRIHKPTSLLCSCSSAGRALAF